MTLNCLARMISANFFNCSPLTIAVCDGLCLLFNWKALVAAMYWHPTDQHVNEQVPWRFTFVEEKNRHHIEGRFT